MTNKELRLVIKAWFKAQPWWNTFEKEFNKHLEDHNVQSADEFIETYPSIPDILGAAFVWPNNSWLKRQKDYARFLFKLDRELVCGLDRDGKLLGK